MMTFESLGLSSNILRAIDKKGYTEPSPIQAKSIPVILAGQDVIASAQTGTGKTASFVLPLLEQLSDRPLKKKKYRPIRAVILTPTRELAEQVSQNILDYSQFLKLKSLPVYGGVNIYPQIQKLRHGVDIVIATPGRLLDHIRQNTIDLSTVEKFILDEADRMLDMGFIGDIRDIMKQMPDNQARQNLLFTATLSPEIKKLSKTILQQPALIEIAQSNTPAEGIEQRIYPVDQHKKRELLSYMIGSQNWQQTLVFARTKHGTDRLAKQLTTDGLKAEAIHGDKKQGARARALAAFKSGKVQVLVATDVAARGLDIHQLPYVVNYDLPMVAEDYVHRIGRTGRAGNQGIAISLVSKKESHALGKIEHLLKTQLPRDVIPGYEPTESIDVEAPAPKKKPSRKRHRKFKSKKAAPRASAV